MRFNLRDREGKDGSWLNTLHIRRNAGARWALYDFRRKGKPVLLHVAGIINNAEKHDHGSRNCILFDPSGRKPYLVQPGECLRVDGCWVNSFRLKATSRSVPVLIMIGWYNTPVNEQITEEKN